MAMIFLDDNFTELKGIFFEKQNIVGSKVSEKLRLEN